MLQRQEAARSSGCSVMTVCICALCEYHVHAEVQEAHTQYLFLADIGCPHDTLDGGSLLNMNPLGVLSSLASAMTVAWEHFWHSKITLPSAGPKLALSLALSGGGGMRESSCIGGQCAPARAKGR